MEIKNFFSFRSKYVSSAVQASAQVLDLEVDENSIKVNDHDKLIEGKYDEIDFPVIFKQEYGKNLKDILDTGWPSLYLISDKMKTILEENLLTGWKTFPIKLYDKHDCEIPQYYGFSVVGRCGPTNYENSDIIEKRKVPTGPLCQYYKGVSFDAWDGNDFFIPKNTMHIFITKKVAEVLRKNKITNIELTNLSEIEIDVRAVLRQYP